VLRVNNSLAVRILTKRLNIPLGLDSLPSVLLSPLEVPRTSKEVWLLVALSSE